MLGINSSDNFVGGGHFNEIVIEILHSGKRRRRFCDREKCRYIMNKIQCLSILQVIPVLLEKINDIETEYDASVHFPEEEHSHGEDYDEDKNIGDFLNPKRINSGNVPQQQNSSAKYCNGENTSHPELPGSGKYFLKLINIPQGQNLQIRINDLKSRNTAQASFDAAMKYPMNFVAEIF